MKPQKILLPLIILSAAVVVVWLIFATKPEAKKFKDTPTHKLRTEVMMPKAESYQVWVPSYGIVKPKTQSLVIAQVSGQVTSVSDQFRDGAFFEKGDVLLTIDDADYQAQLTIAKAEYKQAEFTLEDEKARSEMALKDWQKLGNTNKPPSLVAREPQLNSALSILEASRAKVIQAELNLKRTQIVAPFSGRVLSLDVNVGQVVNNGSTLGNIYAVDSVEIRLPLKGSDLAHLNLPELYRDLESRTKEANIAVKLMATLANKTHTWPGELVRVEGTIDAQTRQLYVVVEVKDPYKFRGDGTPPLKVGQFVNALIQGNTLDNVVVLPRAAVATGNYINLIENGVLERVHIDTLWMDDEQVVIENKFTRGQRISTTPLGDAVSGTAVEIIKADGSIESGDASGHQDKGKKKRGKGNKNKSTEQGS
ncbi:efflux RND transporter periplasmic adaptor subunit [Marinicella rhabdoformis]|uniref:efflux RND transporter periplasmic adaptor subunit n=1 Tax=Marinicella rhabdoformis TaxID=2580566 RepID=UPI0012AECDB6|nr:efflux RND transporter periplasmic adaptor subunit [Marinicella rhabdoformis]